MTLSRRLLLLSAIAVISLVVTCVVNFYLADRIYSAASFANRSTVPSLETLSRAAIAMARARTNLWRGMAADNQEQRSARVGEARTELEALFKALKDYETQDVADDEDRRLIKVDQSLAAQFFDGTGKIINLLEGGDRAAALQQAAHVVPIGQMLEKSLDDHVAYSRKLGQDGASAAMATRRTAMLLSGGISLLAAVLLGMLSVGTASLVRRKLATARATTRRIAEGDLRAPEQQDRAADGRDEIGELLVDLDAMRVQLATSIRATGEAVRALQGSAQALSSSTTQAAAASEQQSSASSEAAAAIEQLTVSIDQLGHGAQQASAQATRSGGLARDSGRHVELSAQQVGSVAERVESTSRQLSALSGDVQEIGSITTVIREVAEQTNLLALNAAIEAARAGEQGRGFAVVADEVRKLAERTTSSVHGIDTVIQRIQAGSAGVVASMAESRDMVGKVTQSARESAGAMHQIVESADTLQQAIAAITAALDEQRVASTEVSRSIESIAQVSEENAAASTCVSQTARDLLALAGGLEAGVARFRL